MGVSPHDGTGCSDAPDDGVLLSRDGRRLRAAVDAGVPQGYHKTCTGQKAV